MCKTAVVNRRQRRGLIRSDFGSEEPTVAPRSSALEPAVRSILEFAALAPSGHNAQPWCVKASVLATGVDLRIGSDRSRWLAKVDPANRELALSIGAFLENLLIAAPPHGHLGEYSVTGGDAGDEELVRVTLKPAAPRPASLETLRTRRTLRSGQQPRSLSSADAKSLADHFDHRAHFFNPTSREGRYLTAFAHRSRSTHRTDVAGRAGSINRGLSHDPDVGRVAISRSPCPGPRHNRPDTVSPTGWLCLPIPGGRQST